MKQRIELNMHSNYSKMNGVNSAREIVEHAAKLGMEAIAFTDIGSVKALPQAYKYAKKEGIKLILGMEAFYKNGRIYCEVDDEENYSRIIFLVKNETGRKNLYKLMSAYFQNGYAELESREGLFIGTNGIHSDVIRKLGNCDDENEIIETMKFYDFILVDPLDAEEDVKKIIALSKVTETLVIASNSPYYLKETDSIARRVLLSSRGKEDELFGDLALFTTEKMLAAFDYLGEQAEEVVMDNAYKLLAQIEDVRPIPPGSYYPDLPKGAYAELEQRIDDKVKEMYGETLPELVKTRLETELGFLHGNEEWSALPFWVAMKLVDESKANGFPVISRGAVGSSLIAYCLGLTQTNPLLAHYRCEHCHHTAFASDFASGFDLPAKKCPHCGNDMVRDGHNIPYETLFAYEGDKEPYLALNYCTEYREACMAFVETLFDNCKTVRGGLASIVPYRTAKSLVENLLPDLSAEEKEFVAKACEGVFRRTCMNPAALLFIPQGYGIEDFTPVEVIEDEGKRVDVTHFPYSEALYDTLFKVDIIGHDAPEMLQRLEEKTGAKPTENDIADNAAILEAIEAGNTGGILEMDTDYVRAAFAHTKPQKFSDYVTLNGLFHGTDTYEDNAKDLLANKTCELGEVIDFRESVFQYLDRKRLEYEAKTGKAAPLSHLDCYRISEAVRKGKLERFLPEYEEAFKEIGVPDWYLESAKKILYLFPKAHAVEYMITAFKQLWYKLNYPKEFEEVQEEMKAFKESKE